MSKSCGCPDPIIAVGDTKSSERARRQKSRRKLPKRKRYGEGPYCVFSSKNKKVRCFKSKKSAENVARGFGSGYRVQKRHNQKEKSTHP